MVNSDQTSRFISYLQGLNYTNSREMNLYPGLSTTPWYDPSAFSITKTLEQSAEVIRAELAHASSGRFQPERESISRIGNWDILPLYQRGRKNVGNCALCPITTEIIESHETVRTLAGLSYFSRLGPRTHVAAHVGPTNVRIRCHLGLSIPSGRCGIRIADKEYGWKEGECIVFDDSLPHEAWNDTDKERTVLIVDLWHPELSKGEILLLKRLHTYTMHQGEALNRYWREYAANGDDSKKSLNYD